ncbi:LPD29 domain-containing protein [Paenibacillus hubeiensis]|uniref:LPD29 domain-containing protein n=1 Tax=Paenibacillus hubeiensis TaxID=3077330 RepID=UPI0031BAAD1F
MKNIPGKETKKHIQEALKLVFPGFKFSMRSDYDSVHVSWVDGPVVQDVELVLNRFESYTRVLWKTDYEECTGYEWRGDVFAGPRYLNASRQLSEERRAALVEAAGSEKAWLDMNKPERLELERDLIRTGALAGLEPRPCKDLLVAEKPVIDKREKPKLAPLLPDNVVPFPVKQESPEAAVQDALLNSLSPEQRLKADALYMLAGEALTNHMLDSLNVDDAFALMAHEMYS